MNFKLKPGAGFFPEGTTVKAYLRSNWSFAEKPPSGAPKGAATAEAVVGADGSAEFAGLAEKTDYYAAAEVGGVWRYVRFRTATEHEGGPAELPSSVVSVIPIQGVVADGATDNYAVIMAALEGLTHGGGALLPNGPIATSQIIVPPEGTYLVGPAISHITYDSGPYQAPVLIGTVGSELAEIVHLSNAYSGLVGVGVNAFPGKCKDGVLIDSNHCFLDRVRLLGGKEHTALNSTTNAVETDLHMVRTRGYSGSSAPALVAKGSDWIAEHVWTLGPSQLESAGGLWSSCHFVCNSTNGGPNLKVSAGHFANCYVDGTAENCLIEATGGPVNFLGGRFYQNAGVKELPILKPGGNTVVLEGVVVPANGASNRFSSLANSAVGVKAHNIVLEGETVEKLWGEGQPYSMSGVRMNGVEQASVLGAPQTTLNGTTAGSIIWSMPDQGTTRKKVIVYLNEYKNGSGTAQKITFPVEFVKSPMFLAGTTNTPDAGHTITGSFTLSKESLTFPKEMAGALTDWIIIEGY